MTELNSTLKKYWGFDELRPLQSEAVNSILSKKDTLVLLPTGGGKSLCYQLPAVISEGITIVVSPLISLMQDQVEQLLKRKIKALHLAGNRSQQELDRLLGNAAFGSYKVLYISPERLQSEWILERLKDMQVSLIAVDEAHCISQWGYDFRPSYLNIKKLRQWLPKVPVMALTATATKQVLSDIKKELLIDDAKLVRDTFFRTNLAIKIIKTERKEARCISLLNKTKGTSIIYLRSRNGTVKLAKFLNQAGISAAHYHAGMEPAERAEAQKNWMHNKTRVMVATTAFGMGIDKSDVRLVIHLDIPDSPESYYQEIGRAGRDGNLSQCILFYNQADVLKLEAGWKDAPDLNEIRNIYSAFFSDQQIAIGAGQYLERPLKIYSFSSKYKFSVRHIDQAFTLLDRMMFLKYEDVTKRPSSLKFVLKGDELYTFQIKNPSLEPVAKALLRLYGGITEYRTNISEELVSRKTGLPVFKVIEHIEILAKRGVVKYKKRYNGTTITLLTERLPDSHIRISSNLLKLRQANKERRAVAMLNVVENQTVCRMQQLVKYFDETTSASCGICDACIQVDFSSLENIILKHLKKGEVKMQSLAEYFPDVSTQSIKHVINNLIDDGLVKVKTNGAIALS